MNDLGDTGQPVPTHYGVLIYLGDRAGGVSGGQLQLGWIASGDEATCWAAIEQWTATHRLRAGEHAEVLARAGALSRELVADERDRVADEREAAADRRDADADERERDLDRRQAELSERVRDIQATSAAAVTTSVGVLDDARARLARTKAAVERSREQVRRLEARARREQAGIDRQVATTRRNAATRAGAQPTASASTNDEQPDIGAAARELLNAQLDSMRLLLQECERQRDEALAVVDELNAEIQNLHNQNAGHPAITPSGEPQSARSK